MIEPLTPRSRPRLKVCCISSTEEAALAIRCGADAIGLVSSMPSGPGVIPDDRIAEISTHIPPGVTPFLLTSSRSYRWMPTTWRRSEFIRDHSRGQYQKRY